MRRRADLFHSSARTFYLRYWFDVPPINVLLTLHGLVFTAWFALFIVQTRLIAANNVRAHMQLGVAGVVLAILVIIVSIITTVESASAPRLRPMGMNSQQFAFVPFFQVLMFTSLFGTAVAMRRKPQFHRRLMTLAMVALLGPPVARILLVSGFSNHFLLAQTLVPALFVGGCLVYDWVKSRIVHPVYAWGFLLLTVTWPIRVWVAQTPQWEQVGRWLAGMPPA
ncbi:MAG TPA: hypothetical protein VMF52_03330 [Steroidobacteraceae bacterium]|nr:hypothetical protein [Steroidobacteraceae bacterium]